MTEPLWTHTDAARATGGTAEGRWTATGVSIDSRQIAPGDLFVALQGPNFDGHRFAADALAKGAGAAMLARRPDDLPADAPVLMVADTQAGLEALGAAGRARTRGRVIAITGSVGKTGTKEALRQVLAAQGRTHASAASHNNHWGVPLSLARMPADCAYAVFELGMNHPGEIRALSAQARPEVALITTIAPAHLGFFDSEAGIADAKAEIFEGVVADGTGVLNRDNPHFDRLARAARAAGVARLIAFGGGQDCQARLVSSAQDADGSDVEAEILGTRVSYRLPLAGAHWARNSVAVLATAAAAGADVAAAAGELANLHPVAGRGERRAIPVPGGTIELIDDSYNANPTSMRAAIDVLAKAPRGTGRRRIAVLGDMLELGRQSRDMHAALAAPLAEADVDLVFTCGDQMAALDASLPAPRRGGHAADADTLAGRVAAALQPGDTVLVKGSAGARTGRIVAAIRALAIAGGGGDATGNGNGTRTGGRGEASDAA